MAGTERMTWPALEIDWRDRSIAVDYCSSIETRYNVSLPLVMGEGIKPSMHETRQGRPAFVRETALLLTSDMGTKTVSALAHPFLLP